MTIRKYANIQILSAAYGKTGGPLMKDAHRVDFSYDPQPGMLYVRCRAISSRCNENGDEFPAAEIKKAYRTFIGKPVFVSHNNENHRRARGVIIDAALHEDSNADGSPDVWAELCMEIDAVHFPKLAEAVVKGEIGRTSMGTDVEYSLCGFCGNKAATPAEYCKHIPRLKLKRIRRMTASGSTEDVLVREICYGLHFFENSLLVEEPADPTAVIWGVDVRGLSMSAAKTAVDIASETEYDPFAPGPGVCPECYGDGAYSVLKDDGTWGEEVVCPACHGTGEWNENLTMGSSKIATQEGGQDVLSSFKLANGAYPRGQVERQTTRRSIRSEGKPLHQPDLLGSPTTRSSNGHLGKIMSFGGKRVASLHKVAVHNPCHVCGDPATHDVAGSYATCDNCWGLHITNKPEQVDISSLANRKLAGTKDVSLLEDDKWVVKDHDTGVVLSEHDNRRDAENASFKNATLQKRASEQCEKCGAPAAFYHQAIVPSDPDKEQKIHYFCADHDYVVFPNGEVNGRTANRKLADRKTDLIYCGKPEPTDECESSGYCDYHNGSLEDWTEVAYKNNEPVRTTVKKEGTRKLAYGETIAPPQVDTMRDEECPVCGSDLYDGDQCQVCFAPDTLIHTDQGYIPIASVEPGDRVLSSDGKFHLVEGVQEREFDGIAYELRTKSMTRPIIVTPEHPIYSLVANHIHETTACRVVRCREYGARREVTSGGPNHGGVITHELDFVPVRDLDDHARIATNFLKDTVDIDTIVVPDQYRGRVSATGISVRSGPQEFELTPDFLWAIGLYLAEGSSGTRQIQYSLHEKEIEYVDRLTRLFEGLGFTTSLKTKEGNKGVQLDIYSTTLSEWFPHWLGHGCENKAVPSELMNLPIGKLNHIMQGVWDGDGGRTFGDLGQTSRLLAMQVAEWTLRRGLTPTQAPSSRPNKKDVYTTRGLFHEINQNWTLEGRQLTQIKSLREVPYAGPVYNLQVEGDPTYTVENILVHNCQFIKPPDMFMDPDLSAAQDADFRQDSGEDQLGDQPGQTQDLTCDTCGEAFPGQQIDSVPVMADPGVNQEPTNVAANPQSPLDIPQGTVDPMADPGKSTPEQPQPTPDPTGVGVPPASDADGKEPPSGEKLPKPGVDDDSKKSPDPNNSAGTPTNTSDPKEKKDDSSNTNPFAKDKQDQDADPKAKGSSEEELGQVGEGPPDASADDSGTTDPVNDDDPTKKDPSKDPSGEGEEGNLKVGDPCPKCGQGTLNKINDLLAQDQTDGDDPVGSSDDSAKDEDGKEKDPEEKGSDDEDKPPWLKDKKASLDLAITQSNWLVEAVVNLGELAGIEL